MPIDTVAEVARANALLESWRAAGVPIHGGLRLAGDASQPFPLITAGLHCERCGLQSGGALDLSGEVGPTDAASAVRSLAQALASRGCPHVAPLCAPGQ